jgi:hypothetical protein
MLQTRQKTPVKYISLLVSNNYRWVSKYPLYILCPTNPPHPLK